jgi:hypothetical protein
MTGDAAMEETLFLVKPELMVAMALNGRMVDEEAIRVTGALKYSHTIGYGQSFEFGGDEPLKEPPLAATDDERSASATPPPTVVCAIDAIRGGGPAMTEGAMLRDMNKARIAFDGAEGTSSSRGYYAGWWRCLLVTMAGGLKARHTNTTYLYG